ncbi:MULTISPECIES: succinate dehydrogenase cytochrome b subunit [unclassified Imperialibacter]|uniref:succinate dehydrogenase cytochrome b subunit n=1 Tax=unclassified Imperialibacter TaxID=2629706 RepID=UPI00125296A1|nr:MULTISPECIES: succinate dehydrogenase cytochrome b subunit [unclassified Imperialibacter]CAD5249248.1 Succinate dehydrogenase / fumarate reductase cytochrome b subunit [Imperialibacter sp. 89]CAD5264260.1 Succinate dehydrogenase / fumarate reductase cytochrome b subunit [Imperialibacter sp. 75]VVT07027.1 Succinate dehydrogenase / fumarate reductase cytochrome b subunit [Imperialibacter sp. EC-SDR9]
MSWLTDSLKSSIFRKLLMALTGLFLILFLTVHLAGNIQLIFNDEGQAFNIYAHTMAHNPFIQLVSKFNFAFIVIHVIYSIWLSRINKTARPVKYGYSAASTNSPWTSRNMGILGTLILVFLVIHLKGFWWEFKNDSIPMITYDGETMPNVFLVVKAAYSNIWYAAVYVVSMFFVGFHLSHGFASAFQTLGLNHVKYTPAIKAIGKGYAIIVPAVFALIPILIYIKSLG